MEDMKRRSFLRSAVLGGAATITAATAFGSVAPEAVAEPVTKLGAGMIDPNFAEGRISAIEGSVLRVTGSDRVLHRIQVTNATSVWKLHPTGLSAAAVGDGLYARGVRLDDGVLAADAVWLNIVNMDVLLTSIGTNVLHLQHNGSRVVGHVKPGITAAAYNGTPAVADLSLLQVGRHAKVIGAWRPDTNEVDVATIYASAA